jgi:predicted MPP superfamily phosphohydrolase
VRQIIYPVVGFPALVVAGESLTAVVSEADGGTTQDWAMHITTHDRVSQTYTVGNVTSRYDSDSGCYRIEGIIPPQVPRDVFDLIVTSKALHLTDRQPNAVRIITAFRDDYRFIHVTDLHFGDPRSLLVSSPQENKNAPPLTIVRQILTELSFLDPEFILFSGDLVFGGPYYLEYPWAWEKLSSFSLPMFMVPGNHDGYASVGRPARDGLRYWEQVIGPPYYSFDYGDKLHFTCLNTYDGNLSQRNGISFIVQKWGGTLSPEQMEWLEGDVEEASLEERNTVIVGHHDPRGNVHRLGGENNPADEDNDGYAEAGEISDTLFPQVWNDRESGEAIVQFVREQNALSETDPDRGGISHIFLGHLHSDFVDRDEESTTWWVHTTSAGSSLNSRDDFWGYRVIEVEDDQIVRVNRTAPEGEVIPPGDNDPTNNQNRDYQSYAGNTIAITTIQGRNDGTSTLVEQEVSNALDTGVSGVLKFFMPRLAGEDSDHNNYGYQLSGGTIRTIARSGTDGDGNQLVFYVETEVDPDDTKRVTLQRPVP